jgi:HK97 family phage prohead protease
MKDPVFKAGHQSSDNPMDFTLSNESVDRMGDIIRADGWDLTEFRKNPIALVGHDHTKIVGVWENVKIVGKQLIGSLKLASPGTSELVDVTRRLIEQGILKAVSVGFQPVEATPRKSGEGYDFTRSVLHEVSLVAVPANSSALAIAKSLSPDVADILFAKYGSADGDSDSGQPTQQTLTPNLEAARTRLKAMGIDH